MQTKKNLVLLVDDDPEIIRTLRLFLNDKGYLVEHALDGAEGLKIAKKNPPDVILLDVNMPNMDGWAMIRQLRILPLFTFTPVIFLSTINDPDSRSKGFQLGADDYLDKRYIFDELVYRIEKVLASAGMYKRSALLEVKSIQEHNTSFSGRLEDFGFASLITLCGMEKASGILVLESDNDRHGQAYLQNGALISAKATGHQISKNEEAVYRMIAWSTGRFEMRQANTDNIPKDIKSSTDTLLIEAAQRMDESIPA